MKLLTPTVVNQWSGGNALAVEECPACGSSIRDVHASRVFDHLGTSVSEFWTVFRCGHCRSLYLDPRPSDDSISAAYESYYTHHSESETSKDSKLSSPVTASINGYMNRRFRASLSPALAFGALIFSSIEPLRLKLDYHGRHLFLSHKPGLGRVLDVGSGNGEFLRRAAELGWTSMGIDPDPAAVHASREQGLDAYIGFISDEIPEVDGRYDAITLRHTVEHVPDPRGDLARCLGKLRPGGMLWLAWPNPQGPGAWWFRSAWRGLEVPRHLCIPSQTAMQHMLIDVGFVNVRAIRRGHHARNIARESGKIAGRRPGLFNRLRSKLTFFEGLCADIAATISSRGGDELVMVAFAPGGEKARA